MNKDTLIMMLIIDSDEQTKLIDGDQLWQYVDDLLKKDDWVMSFLTSTIDLDQVDWDYIASAKRPYFP